MRVGIGLPAAVPGHQPTQLGEWAAESERLGFRSVSVIDRLVYDNLDPLVALAAAAARTKHIELMTTVVNVLWRRNPTLLAKQLASVDQISGGRLTAALGMGGWPQDYEVSGASQAGKGRAFDEAIDTMLRVWSGKVTGVSGPIPAQPTGRPTILLAGVVPAGWARAARLAAGWAAPSFSHETLTQGAEAVYREWTQAGREGRPRIVVQRYFCLGEHADEVAEDYLHHYYANVNQEDLAMLRGDLLTKPARIREELARTAGARCDDLVLFPCSSDPAQVDLLAQALQDAGALGADGFDFGVAPRQEPPDLGN